MNELTETAFDELAAELFRLYDLEEEENSPWLSIL